MVKPSSNELGTNQNGPELFFGLVGAVGTNLTPVIDTLKKQLAEVDYEPVLIRLSELLLKLKRNSHLKFLHDGPEDERIDKFMDAGNEARRHLERGDAMALLAMRDIRRYRENAHGDELKPVPRTAYILNSLKHPDEIETLRNIYGDNFFVFATYQPSRARVERLRHRIEKTRRSRIAIRISKSEADEYREKAEHLAERDEKEVGVKFGQDVRGTFPLADFFVTDQKYIQTNQELEDQIRRCVQLLFGAPYVTPTVDEFSMAHAKVAALRSSDLSRQVGAIISSKEGEIISQGCNEVPKAGGGSFWEGLDNPEEDYRDFKMGNDSTAEMKHEIVTEIFDAMREADWLVDEIADKSSEDLVKLAFYESEKPILRGKRVSNIIEFGRIVHAEAFAIAEAARRGISTKNATLYCTTFPCHMCARQIIASGIRRIVFVEPYPKSMSKDLYGKSICVDGDDSHDTNHVVFETFVGIAPNKFVELFEMVERKDETGIARPEDHIDTEPRLRTREASYIGPESTLIKLLEDSGLIDSNENSGMGGGTNGK